MPVPTLQYSPYNLLYTRLSVISLGLFVLVPVATERSAAADRLSVFAPVALPPTDIAAKPKDCSYTSGALTTRDQSPLFPSLYPRVCHPLPPFPGRSPVFRSVLPTPGCLCNPVPSRESPAQHSIRLRPAVPPETVRRLTRYRIDRLPFPAH